MAWIRHCPFCDLRQDVDYARIIKFNKIAVLNFKDGKYQLEFKNNSTEEICCEKCAKEHTIKELWELVQYGNKPHIEEGE